MTNEEFGVVFDDFLSYMEKKGVEKPSFQFMVDNEKLYNEYISDYFLTKSFDLIFREKEKLCKRAGMNFIPE